MARRLASFAIAADGEDYLLHLEDDSGEIVAITATYDQLDALVEAIDAHLDEDAEIDEVED